LSRRSNTLVPLSVVRSYMSGSSEEYLGIQTVPVAKILGSEQRSNDYSRTFAPKKEGGRFRWMSIHLVLDEKGSLPPVSLYEVGGIYFVRDGHHRVSVSRQEGIQYIEAEIIRIPGDLVLEAALDERGIRSRIMALLEKRFMATTGLPKGVSFPRPSMPDGWELLLADIEKHRIFLSETGHTVDIQKAAGSWMRTVYLPVLKLARRLRLPWNLPGNRPADMYLAIIEMESKYQAENKVCFDGQDGTLMAIRQASSWTPARVFNRFLKVIKNNFK